MHSATVRRIGFAVLAIGLLLTALSVYSGQIRFYLVLIIPVLTSDSAFGALSLLAFFTGIILIMIGAAIGEEGADDHRGVEMSDQRAIEARTKVGGVVLIGPIPIVFGSDKKMALIAATVAIIMLAIIVLLLL